MSPFLVCGGKIDRLISDGWMDGAFSFLYTKWLAIKVRSRKSWSNELLELTWVYNSRRCFFLFCRIFARSVEGRCLLCNLHALISPPTQHAHFRVQRTFVDFCIYHLSVLRRIDPGGLLLPCLLIDETNRPREVGTEYAVARNIR